MTVTFIYIFFVLLFLGVPVVFSLIFAPIVGFLLKGQYAFLLILPQRIFSGINQFPILAVPLFMLAGQIMTVGEITTSLVRFANSLLGHVRGGLAHVNILSSILFAGLSGSAVADTSALGSIFFPAMEKDGYTLRFAAAVTAASSVIGPIIPPSLIMILYSFVMETSVAAMFAGGFIPGLLMGGSLMVTSSILAKKYNFPKRASRALFSEVFVSFKGAILPMLTPVIILGGILGGIFTPTEAAGVAAFYALVLTLFVTRSLNVRDLPAIFYQAALNAASILFIVGASVAFGWITAMSRLPNKLGDWLMTLNSPVWVILLLVVLVLILVGMFLDAAPAILILGPVFAPIMESLGVQQIHFAVLMCVILTVGLVTPPMGVVLFLAATMTKTSVEVLSKELLPFLVTHVIVIFLLTYIPELTLFIPRLLGLIQ
jgi:tripartite ATP-independent transporter DctM subunit